MRFSSVQADFLVNILILYDRSMDTVLRIQGTKILKKYKIFASFLPSSSAG